LRLILHLGLYQLRYLSQIPDSAAVNTTVELAKQNGLKPLAGVVNGILRSYLRQSKNGDPLTRRKGEGRGEKGEGRGEKGEGRGERGEDIVESLGIFHSFPDWMIELWLQQLPVEEVNSLCEWFNQPSAIDLRVNLQKTSVEEVEAALLSADINVTRLPHLPQALRLTGSIGNIKNLPGYEAGWWMVQDSSAQLVTYLLDPQPGETVIDACAAPGGKTTHIAELMRDRGIIWACDRSSKRLKKVKENAQRLGLKSIQTCVGDSRQLSQFKEISDRVLLDAPCSGLGTLHKRPDIRWQQKPEKIGELSLLQKELLKETATWVKPGGILVYSTCTLNEQENEEVICWFLKYHSNWQIELPPLTSPVYQFMTSEGWIKVFPHRHYMDGFFMVKLKRKDRNDH
jgi:16S rRNA (cytosine967-C5)-methyltransferase